MKKFLLLSCFFIPQATLAETYEISVTRDSSNVYRIDGKNSIIHTKYCYVYAYSENAYLRTDGYNNQLIFIDSKDSCDVSGVYGENEIKNGSYEVKVSREDDDWYNIWGTDHFIKTSMCLNLALMDDAILRINGMRGDLIFNNGSQCQAENIYSKIKL
ncbi:hypothetical protein BIY29_05370 [Brenneria alni]|uniref:Uncharacterized protein n=2 Tax=Brenneria alni TaxID=71656 RepID=A0A421DRA8_9GAMM|nr:hypothetical protein BIY29_05370 [Brenneria alni]